MSQYDYLESAHFEHRFWLQILGDHSRFIFQSLTPNEVQEIQTAAQFIDGFDRLLTQVRTAALPQVEMAALTQQAYVYANEIREFKLHLMRRLLHGDIQFHLPETFLNHMVNEVEEYIRILGFLVNGQTVHAAHPVHHHLLWLPDAAGHAVTINDMVDPSEKHIRTQSLKFTMHFEQFYTKAIELAGYLRSNLSNFPALKQFNTDAALEICVFRDFLHEIEELSIDHRLLGTLSPLLPDHMMREECYYLTKLAQVSEVKAPNCDPAKPRKE